MRKAFLIILVFVAYMTLISSMSAEPLNRSVEKTWTVDLAKIEVFKDVKQQLDLSWASPIDPEFNRSMVLKNDIAKSNKTSAMLPDVYDPKTGIRKEFTTFSDGWYSVRILAENMFDKVFYYDADGNLGEIDFAIFPYNSNLSTYEALNRYPNKFYKHKYPSGELLSLGLRTRQGEEYLFNIDGSLEERKEGSQT